VMPIIFASTLLTVPPILLRFLLRKDLSILSWLHGGRMESVVGKAGEAMERVVYSGPNVLAWVPTVTTWFDYNSGTYMLMYAGMVLFFCFFWVANQFNPIKIADDLKRSSAYVPGYRPGNETADYLNITMTRVTTAGAVFLTVVALLPMVFSKGMSVPMMVAQFFGGTSLLIMVGVMLDTLRQMEAMMLTHGGYDTFARSGRLRGRNR
jgi:preprotein translocase subunit SecY